jgi:hypothetical protein
VACDIGAFEADPVPKPPAPGPGPGPDQTPPGVTGYALSSTTLRAFTSGGSIARAPRGTRVSYTLTEAATATFTVRRATAGRRVKVKGKRTCVKPTKRNHTAKRCTRYVSMGSFTRVSQTGLNRFVFTGRVRGKALKPGSYQLVLVATDAAGNRSQPKSIAFKVAKR